MRASLTGAPMLRAPGVRRPRSLVAHLLSPLLLLVLVEPCRAERTRGCVMCATPDMVRPVLVQLQRLQPWLGTNSRGTRGALAGVEVIQNDRSPSPPAAIYSPTHPPSTSPTHPPTHPSTHGSLHPPTRFTHPSTDIPRGRAAAVRRGCAGGREQLDQRRRSVGRVARSIRGSRRWWSRQRWRR